MGLYFFLHCSISSLGQMPPSFSTSKQVPKVSFFPHQKQQVFCPLHPLAVLESGHVAKQGEEEKDQIQIILIRKNVDPFEKGRKEGDQTMNKGDQHASEYKEGTKESDTVHLCSRFVAIGFERTSLFLGFKMIVSRMK